MRIKVSGDCPSAKALRGELAAAGYVVTEHFASYTIMIEESAEQRKAIMIDAIDCELERQVINAVAQNTAIPIVLLRPGGVQSDRAIRVIIPPDEECRIAAERGLLSGLVRAIHSKKPASDDPAKPKPKPWYRRILR